MKRRSLETAPNDSIVLMALSWFVIVFVFGLLLHSVWKFGRRAPSPDVVIVPEVVIILDPLADSLKKRILVYSSHALERMAQREISWSEVELVKANGLVNWSKSSPGKIYSLEAVIRGRRIRIVLAPYLSWFASVVTVIKVD